MRNHMPIARRKLAGKLLSRAQNPLTVCVSTLPFLESQLNLVVKPAERRQWQLVLAFAQLGLCERLFGKVPSECPSVHPARGRFLLLESAACQSRTLAPDSNRAFGCAFDGPSTLIQAHLSIPRQTHRLPHETHPPPKCLPAKVECKNLARVTRSSPGDVL